MNCQDPKRAEINLIDLFINILMKWRLICIVSVIACILLGGVQYFKNWKDYNNPVKLEEAKKEYENSLKEYKINKETYEREIENLERNIELNQKYLDESILMKINPYDKPVASSDIFIKTSDSIEFENGLTLSGLTSNSIIKAYSSYLNLFLTDEKIAKMAGTEPQYLKELIQINTDYNTGSITLTVTHKNLEQAKEVRDTLIDSIYKIQIELQSSLGEHEIYTINQKEETLVDFDLDSKQNSYWQKNIEYETQLKEKTQLLEELKEPKQQGFSKLSIFIIMLKGMGFGAAIGFFCIVCIIGGKIVVGEQVLSVDEINHTYHLIELGILFKDKKPGVFHCIDMVIRQFRGIKVETKDNPYDLILTKIDSYKNDTSKILLIGTVTDKTLQELTNILNERIDQYRFEFACNISYNIEALKKLSEYEEVIIVEEVADSCYRDIDREIKILKQMKKNIIGSIIIVP